MKAVINIGLKKGVLDDQGKAIHHALGAIGFKNLVQNVRVGKQLIIELDTENVEFAKLEATKMCEKLLANTVIEDFSIEIL